MFRAKPKTGPNADKNIDIENYDKARDGDVLGCTDSDCGGELKHRKGHKKRGNTINVRAHFFSVADHRLNCPAKIDYQNYQKRYAQLKKLILETDKPIHLHLNMDDGDFLLTKDFNKVAAKQHNRNSIKNITELLRVLEDIEQIGEKPALERVFLNYKGYAPVPYSAFFIGDDSAKMTNLSRDLCDKNSKSVQGTYVTRRKETLHLGHPCLISFTAKNDPSTALKDTTSTSITLNQNDASHLKLETSLWLQDNSEEKKLAPKLAQEGAKYILAVPYINMEDTRKAFRDFKSGKKPEVFVKLRMKVTSVDQVADIPQKTVEPQANLTTTVSKKTKAP